MDNSCMFQLLHPPGGVTLRGASISGSPSSPAGLCSHCSQWWTAKWGAFSWLLSLACSSSLFSLLLNWSVWQPTPVLLLGKSRGWRSVVGYSPWGHKELDTTEQLHFHFHRASQVVLVEKNLPSNAGDVIDAGLIAESGRCPGEGNGNLLQYSCLGNTMDRGAWSMGSQKSHTQLSN